MARQGVDGVKLYIRAGPDIARAVIDDAHRRGWPVTGHLEDTRPSAAARMGIDNLEHVSTLLDELRRKSVRSVVGYRRGFANVAEVDLEGRKARTLIKAFARNHVAVTPTLTVARMPVEGEKGAARAYAGWAEIPVGWSREWKRPYWDFISTKGWTDRDFRTARSAYRKCEAFVRQLYRAGVPIVAGTDTPAPWVLPGAGLVHELELLVQAGLSPTSALQAATMRAAEVLRKSGEVGTLRAGRRADFVLLDADPQQDIRNLRTVSGVYLAGKCLDLAALRAQFQQAHR
jgi:imidazolonepropionase-like amidohydrolase